MLSLEVCLRCDDDDGSDGGGSGVGLSARSDLGAIFYMAVSYSNGATSRKDALTTGARLKENLRFTMVDIKRAVI